MINRKMRDICNELCSLNPKHMAEVTDAVNKASENPAGEAESCQTEQDLEENFVRHKGKYYSFKKQKIRTDDNTEYIQLTAKDVTRQQKLKDELKLESRKLKNLNSKLMEMYARMTDDVKERESLAVKVYVHDSIGRSILTIRDIMGNNDGAEKKLEDLREAVAVLSHNTKIPPATMEDVKCNAKKIGVEVRQTGNIPEGTKIERITAAAVRECVTNCVKHAKGNEVTVNAERNLAEWKISITNNGEKPKEPIRRRRTYISAPDS